MLQLYPITGEFRDAAAERAFRDSVLGKVQHDSRITLTIAAVLTAMFVISDYNFVGLTPLFYMLVGLRGVMIAGCLSLAILLRSSSALLTRPWLYSVAPLLVATGTILLTALRPESLHTQLIAVTVIVMAFYLFVPNLLSGMIGTSLYLSGGFLFGAWYWAGQGPVAVLTYGLLLVMANIVGYVVALRLARLQRQQFALLRDEKRSKQLLLDEVARRQALENRLRRMAQTDVLTGLGNRRHFMETARMALAAARQEGRPFSLCMIDVDNFKAINDGWGHGNGDRVLRDVADECTQVLRKGELVARFGGEEFVAALPGASLEDARLIAERLRERVSALRYEGELSDLRVTVTIGVSEVLAKESDLEAAIRRADAALYLGKRSGRNVVLANTIVQESAKAETAPPPIREGGAAEHSTHHPDDRLRKQR